ncbi:hypothetical protein KL86SPO_60024 [uncultured Sporomusa sp.]|uniref:Uncharacterized protein n=1 Tax=uncultured Sporomusa sp. TaxID=307249 RepID=A0A212LZT5_9FIRM|nr:hypothetical protein KL86SPO_60024 [uncultured Sporomusa sp.]
MSEYSVIRKNNQPSLIANALHYKSTELAKVSRTNECSFPKGRRNSFPVHPSVGDLAQRV